MVKIAWKVTANQRIAVKVGCQISVAALTRGIHVSSDARNSTEKNSMA